MTKDVSPPTDGAWPPKDAKNYVRSSDFLQLLQTEAMEMINLYDVGGAFAQVLDWVERQSLANEAFFFRFPTRDDLRRYLARALVNRARGIARQERHRPLVPLTEAEFAESVAHIPSPLASVSEEDLTERLKKALEDLPPRQQQVLMRVIQGDTFRQAALVLGISSSTAHYLYREACRHMADQVRDW